MEYNIRFKDCQIGYDYIENKTKPTLVLLHSYASSMQIFDQLVIILKKHFNILLIDLPGHGKSQTSNHVGLKDMPEIINTIFDHHDIFKAHFLGVYEGAIIAQAFAHIYEDKLISLTSISGYSIYLNSHKIIQSEYRMKRLINIFRWLFNFKAYKAYYIDMAALSDQGKRTFEKSMAMFRRSSIKTFKGYDRFFKLNKKNVTYPTYLICGQYEDDVIKDACMLYEQKRNKTIIEGFNQTKRIVFLDQTRLFQEHFLTFISNQA